MEERYWNFESDSQQLQRDPMPTRILLHQLRGREQVELGRLVHQLQRRRHPRWR
jgi:hypothetical protein